MLKILIVDDEKPIRRWFAFCIEKMNKKYQVVGQAANGQEGFEVFNLYKPDVVITDIRMPVMDGIELMKKIKAVEPTTDVVILTSYADFDYAREAMKQDAAEYMLKMEVKEEDIINMLKRIETKRERIGMANKAVQLHKKLQRKDFVREIIENKALDETNIEQQLTNLNICLNNNNLFVMALRWYDSKDIPADRWMSILPQGSIESIFSFEYEEEIIFLLVSLTGVPSQLVQTNNLYKIVRCLHESYYCSLGVSNIYHSQVYISKAFNEALKALRQEFFKGRGSIAFYFNFKEDKSQYHRITNVQKEILKAIEDKNTALIIEKIEYMFDIIAEGNINNILFIYKVCIEVLEMLSIKMKYQNVICNFRDVDIVKEVKNIKHIEDLKVWVIEYAKEMLENMSLNRGKYSPAVRQAIEYMYEYYGESISLTDVAANVYLNQNYFSQLFKEEVGDNFSNYLTMIRIEKAQQLLKDTNMKTYEVAEKVGYPNLSYFSRTFKKYTGQSPNAYRNSDKESPRK